MSGGRLFGVQVEIAVEELQIEAELVDLPPLRGIETQVEVVAADERTDIAPAGDLAIVVCNALTERRRLAPVDLHAEVARLVMNRLDRREALRPRRRNFPG